MITKFINIFNNPTIAASTGAIVGCLFTALIASRNSVNAKIPQISDDEQQLLTAYRKIKNRANYKYIKHILDDLVEGFNELTEGRYKIEGLRKVVLDDIETSESLKPGEEFLAMTPLPDTRKKIDEYIRDKQKLHMDEIENFKNCGDKGIYVRKVYVLDDYEHVTSQLLDVIEELENNQNVDVKIVARSELGNRLIRDSDVVIFADKKASIGILNMDTKICEGANVYTNKRDIDKWRAIHNSIFRKGKSLKNIIIEYRYYT